MTEANRLVISFPLKAGGMLEVWAVGGEAVTQDDLERLESVSRHLRQMLHGAAPDRGAVILERPQ